MAALENERREREATMIEAERERLRYLFTYHAPGKNQQPLYDAISTKALELALLIHEIAPSCPDRSVALRCVREARMWANSAIANEGKG